MLVLDLFDLGRVGRFHLEEVILVVAAVRVPVGVVRAVAECVFFVLSS